MVLHIVSRSPFSSDALQSCLRVVCAKDAVLLIEDGVYATLSDSVFSEQLTQLSNSIALYALKDDLSSRGLTPAIALTDVIDYSQFVKLCVRYPRSISWF